MGGQAELKGADLEKDGIASSDLAEGAMVEGHAAGEAVLLARRGGDVFAIGAHCTHYGAPLADGLFDGGIVRCPWHHACFDVKTGEAVAAPALNALPCYATAQKDGRIFVTGKKDDATKRKLPMAPPPPARVVVVGAGAAGAAAVEMLRREGYEGSITLVGADESVPVDRPNLSKDYLAGNAPEEWIPLRSKEFYAELKIDLKLGVRATAIDAKAKTLTLSDGSSLAWDALLLATGADPIRLPIPGADRAHVHVLRSLGDSRAIIARAANAKRAVVIGASFIGLEAAASLRARGLDVDVVAPETQPLARVLGDALGGFVRGLHESKGVRFHLGKKPASIDEKEVTLDDGTKLACDLVVMGVGVRPATKLAEDAGIAVDRGVLTDAYLKTNVAGVYAAGDIARYEAAGGERLRVEHWVHAERQGQVAAQNILGKARAFTWAPFFWSAHYDVTLSYVGHAESWDEIEIKGSIDARDATIAYKKAGSIKAVVTLGRDHASLVAESAMERNDPNALAALMR
jgi:NADPH-dependent 2,4-dienoyl-CoA reductase/sulfur reductase-like enzyme/nitrite reductase/ring-hydroxylating ferredoxin subunit